MKITNALFLLISSFIGTTLVVACDSEDATGETVAALKKPSPVITIEGNKNDTAYLFAEYKDRGAIVQEYKDREPNCRDPIVAAETTSSVNCRIPGIYLLTYHADDCTGNPLTPVTRTVHVVENKAGFLSGQYNVVSTCTAILAGSKTPAVACEHYTATIVTGNTNGSFELDVLKIGPQYVMHSTSLNGSKINIGYFSTEYHFSSTASGTLSSTGNTFTIEAKAFQWSPAITYLCKNVYTKRLTISERNDN